MNQSDLDRLKQKLLARQEELIALQEMSAGSRSVVELDQTSVGRVSRIDAMQAQQMALAAGRQRRDELHRIEAALQRIADNTFGACMVCGEDIAVKRLEFDPSVTTCIDCARSGGR